jgi:EAL domain-containing protein (putative c-di-GMP-specific phosphodiesterase class I)
MIVRAAIGWGRSLHMSASAQGVETEAQLEALRSEACGEIQGHLFSKPKPSDEVADMLLMDGNATLPSIRHDREQYVETAVAAE